MNRRNFLFTLPVIALAPELLVPKKTFFLSPSCGWDGSIQSKLWAVVLGESTFYYSKDLSDLLRNKALEKYPIVKVRDKSQRVVFPLYENEEYFSSTYASLHDRRVHYRSIQPTPQRTIS